MLSDWRSSVFMYVTRAYMSKEKLRSEPLWTSLKFSCLLLRRYAHKDGARPLYKLTTSLLRENLNTNRLFTIWAQYNSSDMTATQLMHQHKPDSEKNILIPHFKIVCLTAILYFIFVKLGFTKFFIQLHAVRKLWMMLRGVVIGI